MVRRDGRDPTEWEREGHLSIHVAELCLRSACVTGYYCPFDGGGVVVSKDRHNEITAGRIYFQAHRLEPDERRARNVRFQFTSS